MGRYGAPNLWVRESRKFTNPRNYLLADDAFTAYQQANSTVPDAAAQKAGPVSYTHLTLPTKA